MDQFSDIQIRNDGEEVRLVFRGAEGKDYVVTLSQNDAVTLEQKLTESVIAARATTAAKSDMPTGFTPLPEVILVGRLELQLMSDDSANFIILSRDNRSIHVAFHDKHVEMFRRAFSGQE
jgi:hypothetical protein